MEGAGDLYLVFYTELIDAFIEVFVHAVQVGLHHSHRSLGSLCRAPKVGVPLFWIVAGHHSIFMDDLHLVSQPLLFYHGCEEILFME